MCTFDLSFLFGLFEYEIEIGWTWSMGRVVVLYIVL